MQDARTRRWVVVAILAVVASACAGAGEGRPSAVRTGVSASSTRHSPASESAAVAAPVAAPSTAATSASTTTTTAARSATRAVVAAPLPVSPPAPSVTLVALADGAIKQSDDRPCSNISAQSVTRGQFEVRRSGSTATDLVVRYGATGADADHDPLPGQVTIPAGATSAVIFVDPHLSDGPAPRHEHRSSVLQIALEGGDGYTLGPAASAAVALRFDIDVFGCDRKLPLGDGSGTGPVS